MHSTLRQCPEQRDRSGSSRERRSESIIDRMYLQFVVINPNMSIIDSYIRESFMLKGLQYGFGHIVKRENAREFFFWMEGKTALEQNFGFMASNIVGFVMNECRHFGNGECIWGIAGTLLTSTTEARQRC